MFGSSVLSGGMKTASSSSVCSVWRASRLDCRDSLKGGGIQDLRYRLFRPGWGGERVEGGGLGFMTHAGLWGGGLGLGFYDSCRQGDDEGHLVRMRAIW